MNFHRGAYAVVLLLGVWLCLSPFAFDQPPGAIANARFAGLALMLFAGVALIESREWERWANLALGGWLVVSPFALDFDDDAATAWNAILVGLIVGASMLLVIAPPPSRGKRAATAPRRNRTLQG